MKKLLVIFFGSLVFAFLPIIIAFVVSLVDSSPTGGGEMSAAGGLLVFAFLTLPIGLLLAIVYATRIAVRFFKGETNS